MPTATKLAKSPTWGARPKKQAAETFVSGELAPLNVRLPRPLMTAVKAHCAQNGITLQDWVKAALAAALLPRKV